TGHRPLLATATGQQQHAGAQGDHGQEPQWCERLGGQPFSGFGVTHPAIPAPCRGARGAVGFSAAANCSRNSVPTPVSLENSIVPPCNCTTRKVMARPIPEPFCLVVK